MESWGFGIKIVNARPPQSDGGDFRQTRFSLLWALRAAYVNKKTHFGLLLATEVALRKSDYWQWQGSCPAQFRPGGLHLQHDGSSCVSPGCGGCLLLDMSLAYFTCCRRIHHERRTLVPFLPSLFSAFFSHSTTIMRICMSARFT